MLGSIAYEKDNRFRLHYMKNGKKHIKSVYAKNISEASNELRKFIEEINTTNK